MIQVYEKHQQHGKSFTVIFMCAVFMLTAQLTHSSQNAAPIAWQKEVRTELSKRFSGARITYLSDWQWKGQEITQINRVVSVFDNNKGEITIELEGTSTDSNRMLRSQVVADFSATIKAFVAKRRVQPGEKLGFEIVALQDVDVTQGMNAGLRGMLLTQDQESNILKLESRQTLLENQPVLTSAVQKIHDIKKGDPVRVKLIAGNVVLSTSGISSEAGYRDAMIHVLTLPSKKDVVGKFIGNGIVEIHL